MFSLKNKTALVTGAASGIGAAIAETFVQAGATVWIADRNENEGNTVARRIGGKFISLDVTDEAACAHATQTVGALDILANVAGIGHVGTLLNTTGVDLDKLYAVNVRGYSIAVRRLCLRCWNENQEASLIWLPLEALLLFVSAWHIRQRNLPLSG